MLFGLCMYSYNQPLNLVEDVFLVSMHPQLLLLFFLFDLPTQQMSNYKASPKYTSWEPKSQEMKGVKTAYPALLIWVKLGMLPGFLWHPQLLLKKSLFWSASPGFTLFGLGGQM